VQEPFALRFSMFFIFPIKGKVGALAVSIHLSRFFTKIQGGKTK